MGLHVPHSLLTARDQSPREPQCLALTLLIANAPQPANFRCQSWGSRTNQVSLMLLPMERSSDKPKDSDPQRPHGLELTRPLHPLDFPGKSTGMECHCLLRKWKLDVSISHTEVGNVSLNHSSTPQRGGGRHEESLLPCQTYCSHVIFQLK